jgi:MATE family multidrug resistance protein
MGRSNFFNQNTDNNISEKRESSVQNEINMESQYNKSLLKVESETPIINLKKVVFSIIPNVLNCMIYFFMGFIESHFIGKTKDLILLDGIGLGLLYNYFQYSLLIGLIETILVTVPKFFRNKNYDLVSLQINQTRLIVFFMYSLFIIINLFYAMDILRLVAGGDKPYIKIAHEYIMYTMSANFFDLNSEIYNKYSEAQMFFSPVTLSLVISSIAMHSCSYIFVYKMNLGVLGCGISSNIALFLKLMSIIIYLKIYNPFPESDKCCSKNIFENFWKLLKLSFFSMISYFSEYSFSMITSFLANNLNEILYAKQIILSNVSLINYSFSYGWMNTASILISNSIGENSKRNFIKSYKYLIYLGIIVEVVIIIFFYFMRSELFFFFSEDKSISEDDDMLDYYIFFLMAGCVLEFFQNFLFGVLRACDVIGFTTAFCTVSFLLVHPVLGSLLAFKFELSLTGIFISECAVKIILLIAWMSYLFFKLDIEEVFEHHRISQKKETLESEV